MATGQQVKTNGWRQGSFLSPEMTISLAAENGFDGTAHAIIITQDCDVTHGDLKVEPFVEILFLHQLETINPGMVDGKSSRILHLEAFQAKDRLCFKAQPWNQIRIRREILANSFPDATLRINPGTLKGLIQWIADRYTRTGFPDEFVTRMQSIDEKLRKLMRKEGQAFFRILVAINPLQEIGNDKEYSMDCACAVWPEFWDDIEKRAKAIKAGEAFKELIESCNGITLDSFEVASTDEIPLSYLANYRPWDVFNFLSHRDLLDKNFRD